MRILLVEDEADIADALLRFLRVQGHAVDHAADLETARTAIAVADHGAILLDLALPDGSGLDLLRALRLEDCPLDRTRLVVDHYHRRLGLEPENLAELLDVPLLGTLAAGGNARIQAMNAGEPMFVVAPKDPFCDDIRSIADALLTGSPTATMPPRGVFEKLFG